MRYSIALICCLVASCASYGNGHQPETCSSLADCNPGKDCGDLVQCVDGECDPERTTHIPCMDVTSCSHDDDCVLADKECCCGFRPEDYVAVHQDKLNEWLNRPECQDVGCYEVECQVPTNIEPHCQSGNCVVRENVSNDWYACEQDLDCTRVQATCCECEYGVPDIGINRDFEDEYMAQLMDFCIRADVFCPGYNACTDHQAVCHQGRCAMIYEQCGCEETWDPVCMGANAAGVWATVRNECVADCQEIEWDYHGRCDCAVDCFISDPVCAENGVTYWCGEPEANCNGHAVDYDGECQ
jgi:hypothetical protein